METFIQPKITGYRQLNEEEVALMNIIKSSANVIGELVDDLILNSGGEKRWLSIGQTHLQQGFMALIRAIAKPESF